MSSLGFFERQRPPDDHGRSKEASILFLCTGNAARSVFGGAVLSSLRADVRVVTAGTLCIPGQPISGRARAALIALGLPLDGHRSRQLVSSDLADVDLVVAAAGEHVEYVRREHPDAAAVTGTLKRLVRDL